MLSLGSKYVRILVGSSCHLGGQWLLSKSIVALVCKALGSLVIRLIMEGVTLHCVCDTSLSVVIDDVLIWVT